MPKKSASKARRRSSSGSEIPTVTRQKTVSNPGTGQISAEEMQAILMQAHQAVKPIIKREMESEVVGEDILGFRMV